MATTYGPVVRPKNRSAVEVGANALERVLDRLAVEDHKVGERLLVWFMGGLAGIALATLLLLALLR